MLGGIYSDQRCPICGGKFRDNHTSGLICPNHPHQQATRFMVRFGRLTKRFRSYEQAFRFLTGVRYETDQGKFDIRDYQRDNPLGFANLADQWLEFKKATLARKSWTGLANYMSRACDLWQNRNVKEIGYPEIEDFLLCLKSGNGKPLSSKSRANARSVLHDFFRWLCKRKILQQSAFPEFPEVSYRLKLRKTISKAQQNQILAELYRISHHVNIRIWLGVKWLSTYVNLRPGELLNIKEKHIDLGQGWILIPDPKEREPKYVFLLEEDIEVLRSMPRGFPELHFFRHTGGIKGVREGRQFGSRYLWKWWKRACSNLGIYDVDLYGGTRHSSVIDLRRRHSPEAVKRATMHRTNKAFERYLHVTADELRPLYQDTRTDNVLITDLVSKRTEKTQ